MGLIVGAEGLAGVISPLWSEFVLSNNSYNHVIPSLHSFD